MGPLDIGAKESSAAAAARTAASKLKENTTATTATQASAAAATAGTRTPAPAASTATGTAEAVAKAPIGTATHEAALPNSNASGAQPQGTDPTAQTAAKAGGGGTRTPAPGTTGIEDDPHQEIEDWKLTDGDVKMQGSYGDALARGGLCRNHPRFYVVNN
jgi:hypothetical protein